MSDPKQILLDLTKELSGEFLSEVVEVRGKKYKMQLLNEEETAWSFGLIKAGNTIELSLTSRTAALAVGIREIEGQPLEAVLESMRESLTEEEFEADHKELTVKYSYCKLFHDWLKVQPPSYVGELYDKWTDLLKRQKDAQDETKNSSRESSELDEKKNSTELSQDGETTSPSSE